MKKTVWRGLRRSAFALAVVGVAHAVPPTGPETTSGIELRYIDAGIREQDDFFTHLHGRWLSDTPIPSDQSRWSSFEILDQEIVPKLAGIIERIPASSQYAADPDARKIADLYASFMDKDRRDRLGLAPLAEELRRIRDLHDRHEIPALVAHLDEIGVAALYSVRVGQDERESTRYAASITQARLGLPDRDYYLDPKLQPIRQAYRAHVGRMLSLAGMLDAERLATRIVALETRLARIEWSEVASRDRIRRYNKVALDGVAALVPGFALGDGLRASGVVDRVPYVIVNQPSYLAGVATMIGKTDLASLKAYFAWRLLHAYAAYLSAPFVGEDLAYRSAVSGVVADAPQSELAVECVDSALGDALGRLYVANYFPPERKERMRLLVANMLAAYRSSIDQLDWMGPATKKEAQDKLALMTVKIGYPDRWRDYAPLAIHADDLVGNIMRARRFEFHRQLAKLGQPVDRGEWLLTPQRVDADYNPTMNDITFPAGILQPPFFQADADDAVNYGAIGAVIGHEISHGFDDKGSQSDGVGNLRNWWTEQDRQRFNEKARVLVEQYDRYSPVAGYHVNGTLTLPENIADNSGLAVAYKAYRMSLAGAAAPVIDGLTGAQRFYLGFAQVWRGKTREARQISLIKTDAHSPSKYRTNGTLSNQAGFYDAFGVVPGDAMYLAPDLRFKLW